MEALSNKTLASLAIGAHGQALGFAIQPYSDSSLVPIEDDHGIATYLARPHQPFRGPFLEFYFITCESFTLVPVHVWKEITQLAVEHYVSTSRTDAHAMPAILSPEELRQGLLQLGIVLHFRKFEDLSIGAMESGVVRYVRVLNPEFEAVNWLYLHMERMISPFDRALEYVGIGQAFESKGIRCVADCDQGENHLLNWRISVEWVDKTVVIEQEKLLRLLNYLKQAD